MCPTKINCNNMQVPMLIFIAITDNNTLSKKLVFSIKIPYVNAQWLRVLKIEM